MTINEMNNIKATINNTIPEANVSFIDTNTGAEVTNIPILNIPFMSDEKWRELSEKKTAVPTMTIFTEETELTLKRIITEEFITASNIMFADVIKATDINSLPLDERMAIGNSAFVAECNRVHYIGNLKKIAHAANTKQKNGEELTENEAESITLYNGYFNLVSILYPIAAAKQTAMNPNAKTINAIHSFAIMTAKEKAYSIYENIIKEHLTMNQTINATKNTSTDNEVNYIRMSGIVERDGKAGELFQNIAAAHENGDSLYEVLALEKELDELKATQPDYKYIPDMEEWITEAKENAEKAAEYEAIKAETLANTGDEDLAEDVAWELAYGE